eukprot:TRINITY_DN734_c0_g2_i5.p1 TRINITY_DN734_c0_g2~~TRINITY_DN734_c0_g2_i5.p1  ORF type:complete len:631 (+),score=156.88 TRINITY_DN734_c0_g2_i5:219-2111(+)
MGGSQSKEQIAKKTIPQQPSGLQLQPTSSTANADNTVTLSAEAVKTLTAATQVLPMVPETKSFLESNGFKFAVIGTVSTASGIGAGFLVTKYGAAIAAAVGGPVAGPIIIGVFVAVGVGYILYRLIFPSSSKSGSVTLSEEDLRRQVPDPERRRAVAQNLTQLAVFAGKVGNSATQQLLDQVTTQNIEETRQLEERKKEQQKLKEQSDKLDEEMKKQREDMEKKLASNTHYKMFLDAWNKSNANISGSSSSSSSVSSSSSISGGSGTATMYTSSSTSSVSSSSTSAASISSTSTNTNLNIATIIEQEFKEVYGMDSIKNALLRWGREFEMEQMKQKLLSTSDKKEKQQTKKKLSPSTTSKDTDEQLTQKLLSTSDIDIDFKESKLAKKRYNMIITGPPGVGKTTVARIIAKIFYRAGIVKTKNCVDVSNPLTTFMGEFTGHTAPRVDREFEKAKDGVMFIDEVYLLAGKSKFSADTFQTQAVNSIMTHLLSGECAVILAGYENKLDDFLDMNDGLRSRFNFKLNIPPYKDEELVHILQLKLAANFNHFDFKDSDLLALFQVVPQKTKAVSNGRLAQRIAELAVTEQANRVSAVVKQLASQIGTQDEALRVLSTVALADLKAAVETYNKTG